jgi:hypothetical protein
MRENITVINRQRRQKLSWICSAAIALATPAASCHPSAEGIPWGNKAARALFHPSDISSISASHSRSPLHLLGATRLGPHNSPTCCPQPALRRRRTASCTAARPRPSPRAISPPTQTPSTPPPPLAAQPPPSARPWSGRHRRGPRTAGRTTSTATSASTSRSSGRRAC